MARSSRIKWTNADDERLINIAMRFNAKIAYVGIEKPHIAGIQPAPVSVQDLKSHLLSYPRSEFTRTISSLSDYLKEGAELPFTTSKGVNTTHWQMEQIERTFADINKARESEIDKFKPSIYKGTMHTIKESGLLPRKNTVQEVLPKNWDKWLSRIEAQRLSYIGDERYERYKQNFIKAVDVNLGSEELHNKLEKIPAEVLVQEYYTNPMISIDFVYDPKDAAEISEALMQRLDNLEY